MLSQSEIWANVVHPFGFAPKPGRLPNFDCAPATLTDSPGHVYGVIFACFLLGLADVGIREALAFFVGPALLTSHLSSPLMGPRGNAVSLNPV